MEPEQINSTPVTQPTVVEEQTKKPSKLLVYLLFILIILGLASWAGVHLKKESFKEVQVVNETDNWKTYRNEEYGFEFKYPSEWTSKYHEIDEITYFGTGNKPDDYPSELDLSTYPSFKDLKEIYGIKESDVFSWRQSSGYPLSVKNLNDKKWICNDHEGDGPGDVMSCVFEDKNKVLYFMNFSLDVKTMDKILSTFKFTK